VLLTIVVEARGRGDSGGGGGSLESENIREPAQP